MVFRRGLLLFALLSIVILSACGGSSNNGPGGGGGGSVQDFLLATDSTQNNVAVLNLASDGTIGSLAGGPFSAGAAPSSSVLNSQNGLIYVANFGSDSVSAFLVESDGSLTKAASDISSGGQKPVALGIASSGDFLAVLNQHSFDIEVFSIDRATGALAPLTSAATDSIEAPVAMALDPRGEFLYVTSASTVQLFDFNATTGSISYVDTLLTFDQQTIDSPLMTPDGNFLYVAGSAGGVYGFKVFADGTLEQLPNMPVAAGTLTSKLVLDSTGTLLYASDSTGGKIYGFTINTSTGALTSLSGSPYPAAAGASVMVFDPTENFLYVAQNGTVNAYEIAQSGALTKLGGQYSGGKITSLLTYEVQN